MSFYTNVFSYGNKILYRERDESGVSTKNETYFRPSLFVNTDKKTDYKSIFKEYEFNSIDISITDDKNNLIDFNNIDWSMTLQIDITNEIVENLDNLQDIYFNQHQEL
jgi:hypothetical protein